MVDSGGGQEAGYKLSELNGLPGLQEQAEGSRRQKSKEPRSKLRGIDSMISRFKNKPKQASGYQTQWE